ncbi:MAG: hypothetical protein GF308_00165 [Candidatus Heimdallarchaeota archaeon]|nr:hypothetical protein [Candidatus Heimdallarchaeota archaeon]
MDSDNYRSNEEKFIRYKLYRGEILSLKDDLKSGKVSYSGIWKIIIDAKIKEDIRETTIDLLTEVSNANAFLYLLRLYEYSSEDKYSYLKPFFNKLESALLKILDRKNKSLTTKERNKIIKQFCEELKIALKGGISPKIFPRLVDIACKTKIGEIYPVLITHYFTIENNQQRLDFINHLKKVSLINPSFFTKILIKAIYKEPNVVLQSKLFEIIYKLAREQLEIDLRQGLVDLYLTVPDLKDQVISTLKINAQRCDIKWNDYKADFNLLVQDKKNIQEIFSNLIDLKKLLEEIFTHLTKSLNEPKRVQLKTSIKQMTGVIKKYQFQIQTHLSHEKLHFRRYLNLLSLIYFQRVLAKKPSSVELGVMEPSDLGKLFKKTIIEIKFFQKILKSHEMLSNGLDIYNELTKIEGQIFKNVTEEELTKNPRIYKLINFYDSIETPSLANIIYKILDLKIGTKIQEKGFVKKDPSLPSIPEKLIDKWCVNQPSKIVEGESFFFQLAFVSARLNNQFKKYPNGFEGIDFSTVRVIFNDNPKILLQNWSRLSDDFKLVILDDRAIHSDPICRVIENLLDGSVFPQQLAHLSTKIKVESNQIYPILERLIDLTIL